MCRRIFGSLTAHSRLFENSCFYQEFLEFYSIFEIPFEFLQFLEFQSNFYLNFQKFSKPLKRKIRSRATRAKKTTPLTATPASTSTTNATKSTRNSAPTCATKTNSKWCVKNTATSATCVGGVALYGADSGGLKKKTHYLVKILKLSNF